MELLQVLNELTNAQYMCSVNHLQSTDILHIKFCFYYDSLHQRSTDVILQHARGLQTYMFLTRPLLTKRPLLLLFTMAEIELGVQSGHSQGSHILQNPKTFINTVPDLRILLSGCGSVIIQPVKVIRSFSSER